MRASTVWEYLGELFPSPAFPFLCALVSERVLAAILPQGILQIAKDATLLDINPFLDLIFY